MTGEDRAKWNSSKVRGAGADEVGERGALPHGESDLTSCCDSDMS